MLVATLALACLLAPQERPRARDLGLTFGSYRTGPLNTITDVAGVRVGHATLIEGDHIRTGVTVILPHADNPFTRKVPAAIAVANGFGKLIGSTQVDELGTLESPIALTNTLNVGLVADALVGHMLALPGNEHVRSVNVVVGETNDGGLNDIRGRHVHAEHVEQALAAASTGPIAEGSVGAGTGTRCFDWKGGIGTASRKVGRDMLGVLVQTNFGGDLTIAGIPMRGRLEAENGDKREDGSCMIVIATDAPLTARNLKRLAWRSFGGMARTGASFSNGSGDYAIAFSTVAVPVEAPLKNSQMSRLFRAVAEATEEAIINSMTRATTVESKFGKARAIPIERLEEVLAKHKR